MPRYVVIALIVHLFLGISNIIDSLDQVVNTNASLT